MHSAFGASPFASQVRAFTHFVLRTTLIGGISSAVLAPGVAWAQSSSASPQASPESQAGGRNQTGTRPEGQTQTTTATQQRAAATAGWADGFVLQSEDGDYRLQLGALIQPDGRFALDDSQDSIVDTFAFRRVRPVLQGRVARFFDFALVTDFTGGAVNVRNGYLETRFSPAVRLRVGKDKVPFGLERLQSASSLLFVERGLPTTVAPDRDIGIQILGDVASSVLSYAAGVFNGVTDGASADADSNDGKDLAGRVVVRPFTRKPGTVLAGLGLAIAGSTGKQPAALPSFRTSGQQTFFTYESTATGDGVRTRVSPQVFYYYKSFGGFADYVRSRGSVIRNGLGDDVLHEAWQIAGSIVLTGETATDRGVRPRNPFDPANGHWGAVQLAARYHALTIDSNTTALRFAATGASRRARAVTIGANWYLNPIVKWVLNFERTRFDDTLGANRKAENVILLRNQISF